MRLDELFLLFSSSPKDFYRYMLNEETIVVKSVGITTHYYWVVFEYEKFQEPVMLFEYVHRLKTTFDLMPPAWESIM